MLTWLTTWLTRYQARRSAAWLTRHWLPAWSSAPGAHSTYPKELERTAVLLANEALDCPVWRHHRSRMNAANDPSLRKVRDHAWSEAMRCARGIAAYYVGPGGAHVMRAREELAAIRAGIRAKAGRLDVETDPFAGALS